VNKPNQYYGTNGNGYQPLPLPIKRHYKDRKSIPLPPKPPPCRVITDSKTETICIYFIFNVVVLLIFCSGYILGGI